MASTSEEAPATAVTVTVADVVRTASQFPDIHQFDPVILQVRPTYSSRTNDEMRELIAGLIPCREAIGLSDPALVALRVVLDSVGQDCNQLGHLRADALLAEIAAHPQLQSDYGPVLNQQLEDMNSGFCPSGRVTRLYQVYQAFIEQQ